MSEYHTFDREEKLGGPPWKSDDPKLIAWEAAHGHDVRLKCYPEFGCQIFEAEREAFEVAASAVVEMWDQGLYLPSEYTQPRMDALRAALERLS